MRIDHATLAVADLDAASASLAAAGMEPVRGGEHGDGTTEMAALAFDDGSYLELLSTVAGVPGEEAGFWPSYVAADAGPCAWAVGVGDVASAAKRAIDAGQPVDGPHAASREPTDGPRAEWEMAFVGDGPTRDLLPFYIADRTPRRYRVTPSASVAGGPLTGVETVLLGVPEVAPVAEAFARVHRTATPRPVETDLPARIAEVPGAPVAFAAPSEGADDLGGETAGETTSDGEAVGDAADDEAAGDTSDGVAAAGEAPGPDRLEARLSSVGPAPWAHLLGTPDLAAAREAYALSAPVQWGDRRLAWVDAGRTVGVIEVEETPSARRPPGTD